MTLNIYIDFKSAAFQLAYRPTLELIEKYHMQANWLPFCCLDEPTYQLQQNETKGDTHKRVRQELERKTDRLYADYQNVPLNFSQAPYKTDLALASLLALKDKKLEFISACLDAYWSQGLDLNDADTVLAILASLNTDISFVEDSNYLKRFATHQTEVESGRIFYTPTYVYQEQIFMGRQQLPLIESLIIQD